MNFQQLVKHLHTISSHSTSYLESKIAKTGDASAVFTNGTSFYSLYNPVSDAENFTTLCAKDEICFFIIGGMGNAYHIKKLYERQSSAFFLILEDSYASLKTLFEQNNFSWFQKKDNIEFCTISDLEEHILALYKPALHGTLYVSSVRSWSTFHKQFSPLISKTIEQALAMVSADYSVQTHFGKIWMRNIMRTISYVEQNCNAFTSLQNISLPTKKTAAIIAAGPSLDDSIELLKNNRDAFFIIAADTALEILHKNKIICDVVVTIDGQNISSRLFTSIGQNSEGPQLSVIDCSAHPNAVTFSMKRNIPVLLCTTGHPLSVWFQQRMPFILPLCSGSGTVTITALDFAIKAGFSSIAFFGADFSYPKGKPYARGSYLDTVFGCVSSRTKTIETQFTSLMLRSETVKKTSSLQQEENTITYFTPILSSYKQSLMDYTTKLTKAISFYSTSNNLPFPQLSITNTVYQGSKVMESTRLYKIQKQLSVLLTSLENDSYEKDILLLPYYAWYLKNNNLKPSKSVFFSFKTLVKKQFANYTYIHHES